MSSSVAPSGNICFNSNCKEFVERTRKGWPRRTGEFADLCDRCGSAYDDGKFCEVFHLNSSGWRSCESCGKQIHCGCIVSFHTFVLLDAGGIECIACAKKSFILTPNPAWPPPSLFVPLQPERIKDVNNWNPIAGSGPVPWRQAPSLFNGSIIQNELQHKAPFPEATGSIDRPSLSEKPFSLLSDNNWKDSCEKLMNRKLKIGVPGTPENGYAGHNREEAPKSCISGPWQSSYANSDLSAPSFCLTVGSACKNEPTDHSKVPVSVPQQTTLPIPLPLGKQLGSHATVDSAGETHVRNSKTRGDGRGKHHLLPRYWPRITDQELQRLSEDSNSVITPLFEKMLSASDAGRIGRLVLPKKCAEAYFPPISNPEGLPLKMQDLKGKEWLFQFRFWPNNNSRMYVLEGVTPCIQSMQLQAGDIVTFSRIEPEGKLVMGCRKASTILTADQGSESYSNGKGNGIATNGNINAKSTKFSEEVPVNSTKKGFSSTTHVAATSAKAETKMSDDLVKGSLGNNLSIRSKRKGSTMGSKRKRLRIDNDDLVELKVTVVQAQGLMRPPSSGAPTVIVIEDCEFEEYEQDDAPIIGRPTIPHMDHLGEKIQWVQCEDCFKWRKVSDSVDLPSRWTCSDNSSDPERSVCSAVQELTADHLRDLLPHINKASKKRKTSKQEMDLVEALDGLDALAHLAILEQGETLPASPQATTKHPRHRPGCTCIVCIQPPSGKGPKHKQSCDCNVCKSVKRRFKTLMLKREKKLSEKEAEATCQKLQPQLAGQLLDVDDIQESIDDAAHFSPQHGELNNEGSVHDPNYLHEKKPIVDDPNNEKKSSVDDPNFLNEKKSSANDPSHLNEKKSSVDDPNYLNEKKSSVDDPSYLNEKNSSVDDPSYLNEKKSSVDDPDYLNEKKSSVDDPGYLDEKKSYVNDPNYLNEKKSSVDDPGYFDEKTSYVDDPNYLNEKKSSASPFKGEIDLNAKPERDDELSPGSDSGSMIRILKDAAEQYVRHCGNGSSVSNQKTGDGAGETNPSTCVIVSGSHQTDVDHNRPLPVGTAASLAPNGQ